MIPDRKKRKNMNSRLSIILAFLLASLLAVAGVELFYQGLEKRMLPEDKVKTEAAPVQTKNEVAKNPVQPPTGKKTAAKASAPAKNKAVQKTTSDYSIIVTRKLFGAMKQEKAEKPKPEAVLTTTTLDLTLLGTVTGKDDVQRAVILDKKARTQDLYYNGDAIGPALIKKVERGKVILTIDGKDEVLLMQEPKSIPAKGGSRSQADSLSGLIDKYINIPEDEQKRITTKPISSKSRSRKITFKRPKKQEDAQ